VGITSLPGHSVAGLAGSWPDGSGQLLGGDFQAERDQRGRAGPVQCAARGGGGAAHPVAEPGDDGEPGPGDERVGDCEGERVAGDVTRKSR
jgi:hypothetical protein